jgi:GH25 family lysozyme M1 (1,4-beta-N-acetylmuramidase)
MRKSRILLVVAGLSLALLGITQPVKADSRPVYDVSEWQGSIIPASAKKLKSEAKGVILRVQYGSAYKDKVFAHNAQVLANAGVQYAVYSFSQYLNATDAKGEAKSLYERAPKALFYINDAEQYTTTSGRYSTAVKSWGSEMQSLTSKPVVLYSYRSFYNSYIRTKANYDGFWLASYQTATPSPQDYGLWQYTDRHYSQALGESIDASKTIGTAFNNYFAGSTTDNNSKYVDGGHMVGERVRVDSNAKFYPSNKTIDSATASKLLTVKQVQAVHIGTSNQIALLYNGDQVVGWIPAQYLTGYYHSSKVKKLKVTSKHGINTYLNGIKQNHFKKGSVLPVSGFFEYHNVFKARHAGYSSYFTANKKLVKWVK